MKLNYVWITWIAFSNFWTLSADSNITTKTKIFNIFIIKYMCSKTKTFSNYFYVYVCLNKNT